MRVLITGGAGFIGSYLTEALLAKKMAVYIVDNLSTGKAENLKEKSEFYCLDIRDNNLTALIKKIMPEVVFHLAAQVSVPRSLADPIEDADINIRGTINLLQACAEAKVQRVIFSSSAAVYGRPEILPITEEHPLKPISPYGLGKMTAESYLQLYYHMHGLEYVVLRYANVYGLRQDAEGEGGVVAIFANRIQSEQELTIFGSGEQTRDFVYVKDVVKANLAAMNCATNLTMNISTGQPTSVYNLALVIKKITDTAVELVYKPERPGDIFHSVLSSTLAFSKIGWKPEYTLETGLRDMLSGSD